MLEKIKATALWLKQRIPQVPDMAIVLGSGLGGFRDSVKAESEFSYGDIPGFPVSTVEGHAGRLTVGMVSNRRVAVFEGRFHYYEGYAMGQVTFYVRVLQEMGVKYLVLTNAAGAINPVLAVGDVMLIRDHINLLPEHPLRGANLPYGDRFPAMTGVYDAGLRRLFAEAARAEGLKVTEGVYAALQGPSYETPAECRMLHLLGADAVGMSTVPEAIVACHGGMRVLALSVITNKAGSICEEGHSEVQRVAADNTKVLARALVRFAQTINHK